MNGIVPVLATPFDDSGALDLAGLEALVDFQLLSPVGGLALFGVASESFALTRAERRRVLEVVDSIVQGRVPLVLGVAAASVPQAIEAMHDLGAGRAATFMVLPAFPVRPSVGQLVDFYTAVADEAGELGTDVMIQDAEATAGFALPLEAAELLATHPSIGSIKVESPSTVVRMDELAGRLSGRSADLDVYGGQNAQFLLDEISAGAIGSMPACEFTDVLCEVWQRWTSGDCAGARHLFGAISPLLALGLQRGYAWAVHKELLVARGIIRSAAVRLPAHSLPSAMRAGTLAAYDAFSMARATA